MKEDEMCGTSSMNGRDVMLIKFKSENLKGRD